MSLSQFLILTLAFRRVHQWDFITMLLRCIEQNSKKIIKFQGDQDSGIEIFADM